MFDLVEKVDNRAMEISTDLEHPLVKDVLRDIGSFGSPTGVICLLFLTFFVSRSLFDKLLIGTATLWVSVYTIKFLVSRERPEGSIETGLTSSFPSAHSASAFLLAGLLSQYLASLKPILFLFASLIGLSRIYLRSHYFSDVLSGALIGLLIAIFI